MFTFMFVTPPECYFLPQANFTKSVNNLQANEINLTNADARQVKKTDSERDQSGEA